MRPVVIPGTPKYYKEEELRRKIIRGLKIDSSIEEITTDSAAAKMLDLLDEWLAGGAKYAELDKTQFPNKKQKRNTVIAEKAARERFEKMLSTTGKLIAGTRKRGRSTYTIEDIGSETKSWTLALLRDAFKPGYGRRVAISSPRSDNIVLIARHPSTASWRSNIDYRSISIREKPITGITFFFAACHATR